MNRNTILVGVAIIAIIVTGVLIYANSNHGFSFPTIFGMSDSQIGKRGDRLYKQQSAFKHASFIGKRF